MKKNYLLNLAIATIVASLSACSNDSEDILSQGNEIRLTSEIIPSRVTALNCQSTQIVEGQKVGVTITGASSAHNNVAWTAGADGSLTNGGAAIYYKGNNQTNVTAYHPYNNTWTGTNHVFSVSKDQSTNEGYLASDLLWARNTSDKADEVVPLTFEHKLAKVAVKLVMDNPAADLNGITIYICGTKTSTNFNPIDGILSEYTSATVEEIKAGVTAANAYTASAIVVPQTLPAGTRFIRIVQGNKVYSYSIGSEGKELKSGYTHQYTLTVKGSELKLVTGSMEDWKMEDNEGVINEQNFSWFNPNQYITYVRNEHTYFTGKDGDNTHNNTSYITLPVENMSISKMELKYQMKGTSSTLSDCYLFCNNASKVANDALIVNKDGMMFKDGNNEYNYSWDELNVQATDCMILTVSFKDSFIEMNGEEVECKIPSTINFTPSYLFSRYEKESDSGWWYLKGYGVPEGSKLYYTKIWDENGNLVYLGGASKSLNPTTNQEEYCWRSYYEDQDSYRFAYYSDELDDNKPYAPYGGGLD